MTAEERNIVTLREYFDTRLAAFEKAESLAAAALSARLEHLNALRDDVVKDRSTFVCKAVYDQMHTDALRRIEALERWQSRMLGIGAAAVVFAGILGGIVSHLFGK